MTPPAPRRPGGLSLLRLVLAVLAAAVVGIVVYGVSRSLPKSYQASGTFRVSVPNQQGINDTVVTAANDLASQYAQLAGSQPVLASTARSLHVPASTLNGKVTASTLAAQNIVQVSASASTPGVAQARAQAATGALVAYVQQINISQATGYSHQVTTALAPINKQIAQLTTRVNGASAGQQQGDAALLGSLLNQRTQELQSLTIDTAAGQPALQVISPGGGASVSYPKPSLYALIGFVVALLIAIRVALVFRVRNPDATAVR